MSSLRDKLVSIHKKIAQANPELADNIDNMVTDMDINPMVNTMGNPKIESFAKQKANVSVVNDSGTIHSFAVEIKASKDFGLFSGILGKLPPEFQRAGRDVAQAVTRNFPIGKISGGRLYPPYG